MYRAYLGKERKTERKGEVQVAYQVAVYRYHRRAHQTHPSQKLRQHRQRILEDLKHENTKKSTTKLKSLKIKGRKSFTKGLILPPQSKVKDPGDNQSK